MPCCKGRAHLVCEKGQKKELLMNAHRATRIENESSHVSIMVAELCNGVLCEGM